MVTVKPTSIVSIGAQYNLRLGAEPIEGERLTWNKYSLGKNKRHGAGSTTGSTLRLSKGQFQLLLICPKFLKAGHPSLLNTAKKQAALHPLAKEERVNTYLLRREASHRWGKGTQHWHQPVAGLND